MHLAEEVHKPDIILQYNATKIGVDNLNHPATVFTTNRKMNQWLVVLGFWACGFIIFLVNFPERKAYKGR